jgi:hypothetical protein
MKTIILLIALAGIILIASGYINNNLQCPPPKIEYRYVTKSFNDEQNNSQPLMSIGGVSDMFNKDSPWMGARYLDNPN